MTVAVVVEHAEARVNQDISIDALRKHGLTLPDFASTIEQQMEGFIQIGVDATGSNIAPIDNFVETCLSSQGHGRIGGQGR